VVTLVRASEFSLGVLVAVIVALWMMATLRHAIAGGRHDQATPTSYGRAA
jgi:hypothetical protein